MTNILLLILAYFLGAIPFGLLIGKMKGIDVRKYGSGNIGTSNVARTLGKKAAILTLLGDGLKGLVPVLLARLFTESDIWLVAIALAAIIGHNWPIYLKFKGGKGVTTTYGAFLGIAWLPGLATIATWVVVTALSKKSSIAALISSVSAPLFAYFLGGSFPIVGFAILGLVLIYLRHIENIKRILTGTENTLTKRTDVDQKNQ